MMKGEELAVRVKVTLHQGEGDEGHTPAMGRGVARLCELVDETGSLNKAAKEMGMAYSKAWRIMKRAEDFFGFPLLYRTGPKGSNLTEKGKWRVGAAREVERAARKASNEKLQELLREAQQ